MPLTSTPWLLIQPHIRSVDDQLRVVTEVLWTPAGPPELQLSVCVDDPQTDDLMSLRVSSALRSLDVGHALRQVSQETLNLYRRSLNPFDDLL